MPGKQKCRILKEIRQKIADENDIPYITRECTYQGDCSGTCPRCESELRYLEKQLALRASIGQRVAVAALCAGMALSGTACGTSSMLDPKETLTGEEAPYETTAPTPDVVDLEGEVAFPYKDDSSDLPDSDSYYENDIAGMVAFAPESQTDG